MLTKGGLLFHSCPLFLFSYISHNNNIGLFFFSLRSINLKGEKESASLIICIGHYGMRKK